MQQKNYFGFLLLEFYYFIFILFHFIISFIIQHQYKMTQYNNINGKLSKSQPDKLKSVTTNATGVTLRISSNIFSNSNVSNFPTKLLLSKTQIVRVHEAFVNHLQADRKPDFMSRCSCF